MRAQKPSTCLAPEKLTLALGKRKSCIQVLQAAPGAWGHFLTAQLIETLKATKAPGEGDLSPELPTMLSDW